MSEHGEKGLSKDNVLYCPWYKDIYFTLIEEERNQKIIKIKMTFKKLEFEIFSFCSL